MKTFDEYKVELQTLAQAMGVPVSIDAVGPAVGAVSPSSLFEIHGSFWGGSFKATITKQALDTTLMGQAVIAAMQPGDIDAEKAVETAGKIFASAARKRIDAIADPARALAAWCRSAHYGPPSLVEPVEKALAEEAQLRSAATSATIPTDPAPPSVDPYER